MDKIADVTGGKGGNSFLVWGEQKTGLVDCGMAYCAPMLINNIKERLRTQELDYVFISHSHYDHIGAIPYLREEWPNVKICGTKYDQQILRRPNALKAIKQLSRQASEIYAGGNLADYDDKMMKIDTIIKDQDIIDLGGRNIQVIETPGHTKHTLSFLVNHETLFASESTGYMSKSGQIHPAFITSYSKAVDSINKCKELNPKYIISPHFGLVGQENISGYWEGCLAAAKASRDFILHLWDLGFNAEMILARYEEEFQDEQSKLEQPINAFRLNTQSMINAGLTDRFV